MVVDEIDVLNHPLVRLGLRDGVVGRGENAIVDGVVDVAERAELVVCLGVLDMGKDGSEGIDDALSQ